VPNQGNLSLPLVNATAKSDTTAFQYGFAGNLGYEFNVRQFTITPVGRLVFVDANIDSFEEDNAEPLNLEVDDQDATSFTAHAGLSLGYAFSTRYGVLEPTIRGEFVRQLADESDGARIEYLADASNTSAFDIITEDLNENYGIVGAALTATLPRGVSAFLDAETAVDFGKFDYYALRLGGRFQF
jgi:outer membrane autotransporter protein